MAGSVMHWHSLKHYEVNHPALGMKLTWRNSMKLLLHWKKRLG